MTWRSSSIAENINYWQKQQPQQRWQHGRGHFISLDVNWTLDTNGDMPKKYTYIISYFHTAPGCQSHDIRKCWELNQLQISWVSTSVSKMMIQSPIVRWNKGSAAAAVVMIPNYPRLNHFNSCVWPRCWDTDIYQNCFNLASLLYF